MHLQLTIKGSVLICLAIVIPSSRDTKVKMASKRCSTVLHSAILVSKPWQAMTRAAMRMIYGNLISTQLERFMSLLAEVLTWALLGLLCWFGACSWQITPWLHQKVAVGLGGVMWPRFALFLMPTFVGRTRDVWFDVQARVFTCSWRVLRMMLIEVINRVSSLESDKR